MTIPKFLTQCMIPLMLLICFQSCKEKKQEADGEPTLEVLGKKGDFIKIFDARTLNGWKGDPNYWRVENGCLVGEVSPETLLKSRRLKVQGFDKTVPVDQTQEYIQFTVDLEQGEAELQTWFTLDTEDTLGAYFVSLEKL
ncbi:hypothetical protein [Zobellia sp. 1_MG-2023]|uniref:hypothetical protein n=1 Tax=Zobellia sp. 1_MG-2023 TaxID=3062626 RepID=UPI0026E3BF87|nr:hypothetical protein [Zobellia sp. 1_MG-2023]MDO6819463.1 hypothetical protein [Zobellia sp. 1_MG-2023]